MPLKKASKTRFGIRKKRPPRRNGCFGNHCKIGDRPAFDKKKWDEYCKEKKKEREAKRRKK